jgi:hypothetical protein
MDRLEKISNWKEFCATPTLEDESVLLLLSYESDEAFLAKTPLKVQIETKRWPPDPEERYYPHTNRRSACVTEKLRLSLNDSFWTAPEWPSIFAEDDKVQYLPNGLAMRNEVQSIGEPTEFCFVPHQWHGKPEVLKVLLELRGLDKADPLRSTELA